MNFWNFEFVNLWIFEFPKFRNFCENDLLNIWTQFENFQIQEFFNLRKRKRERDLSSKTPITIASWWNTRFSIQCSIKQVYFDAVILVTLHILRPVEKWWQGIFSVPPSFINSHNRFDIYSQEVYTQLCSVNIGQSELSSIIEWFASS